MASAKALLGRLVGPLLFRKAAVTRVARPSPRFALIELEGADLRDAAWTAGDKVQLFFPDEGLRTYTPLAWDARGATTLLAFVHGAAGPGARWASGVREGDAVQLFGPRRSLSVAADGSTRVAVLGDETSLALTAALATRHDVQAFLEVGDVDEARAALDATGTRAQPRFFRRAPADAHLPALAEAARASAAPLVLFSGRAKSIQALRGLLRGGASKTKAYWADGKSGLD